MQVIPYLPAAKFVDLQKQLVLVKWAEEAEVVSYMSATFTYRIGKEIDAEFGKQFLVGILGNGCPGKIRCYD